MIVGRCIIRGGCGDGLWVLMRESGTCYDWLFGYRRLGILGQSFGCFLLNESAGSTGIQNDKAETKDASDCELRSDICGGYDSTIEIQVGSIQARLASLWKRNDQTPRALFPTQTPSHFP
jgi:hypothetical protein